MDLDCSKKKLDFENLSLVILAIAIVIIVTAMTVAIFTNKSENVAFDKNDYEEYTEALQQATEVILILNERLIENQEQTDRLERILNVYERERLKGAPVAPSAPQIKVEEQWLISDKPNLVESYKAIQEGRLEEYLEEKDL